MKRLLCCLALVFAPMVMAQTAEEILDKAAAKVGDADKLSKLTSITTSGTIKMPQGIEGKMQIMNKTPNKVKVVMDIEAPGMKMQTVQGCDGVDCYSNDPMMGLRKLEGQEKDAMLTQNDMRSQLKWRELYTDVKYEGKESLGDGTEVYKVSMMSKEGMPITNYYRTNDYVLLKSEVVNKGPMGEIKMNIHMEEYKNFQNTIFMPSVMRMEMMNGIEMKMIIDDVDIETELPDSLFKLPPGLE